MRNLLITLTVFFSLFVIPPLIELIFYGVVTGRSLLVSAVLLVGFSVLTIVCSHRRSRSDERDATLLRRAKHEQHRRRCLTGDELGAVEGDLTNWLVALFIIAILLFLVTGRCSAALCLVNPPLPDAVVMWQTQNEVEDRLKMFAVPPRASSFPLPKTKAVSAPIPSAAGLLASGLVGLVLMRRRGGAA